MLLRRSTLLLLIRCVLHSRGTEAAKGDQEWDRLRDLLGHANFLAVQTFPVEFAQRKRCFVLFCTKQTSGEAW